MAGTDANVATVVPFSLHDELQSLSKSGMSNSQALLFSNRCAKQLDEKNTGKNQNWI
jgi:hypothetical protein